MRLLPVQGCNKTKSLTLKVNKFLLEFEVGMYFYKYASIIIFVHYQLRILY